MDQIVLEAATHELPANDRLILSFPVVKPELSVEGLARIVAALVWDEERKRGGGRAA